MDLLIGTFHIDSGLILAQVFNFFLVLTILYYFAIRPLIRNMDERRDEIEKGLDDAKRSEDSLRRAKEDYQKVIKDARKKANDIIEEAVSKGELKKNKAVEDAKEEVEAMIRKEREELLKERELIIENIKEKTAEFVSVAVEKVIRNEMDKKRNEAVIKDVVKEFDAYKRTVPGK